MEMLERDLAAYFTFTFKPEKADFMELSCHNGSSRNLTSKETELLKLLCQNMNQTLDRSLALKMIWRNDSYFNARSMDVYITKLRKYLKKDENIKIITVHGQGFKLVNVKQLYYFSYSLGVCYNLKI